MALQCVDTLNGYNDDLNALPNECEVFEYEQNAAVPILKGRLKSHVAYWRSINANRFIVNVIQFGYRIPFVSTPLAKRFVNNKSAFEHHDFVTNAISELLANSTTVEVPSVPLVVSPLSVSVNSSGKKRLILDLRYLNQHVWKEKFKFEDWRVLRAYLTKGGFMFSFDLKSGYHHVGIFPAHQTYLGFSWNIQGVVKYFCFTALPFGLTSAPYVFTKLLRPLVKFWRFNGIKIVVFIDDGCGTAHSMERSKAHSDIVRYSLRDAGFIINSSKSVWTPVQSLVWLGLHWDLTLGCFHIASKRIDRFLEKITQFLNSAPYVTARACAVIAGHVSSMSPVIGNLTRLKTRYLHKVIDERSTVSWSTKFNVGRYNDALAEIFFWKNAVMRLNIKNINEYTIPSLLVCSDASSIACGGVVPGTSHVCHCPWDEEQSKQSSTWRELVAIRFSLYSFIKVLAGKTVNCRSDSQAAVKILTVGSPKPELHSIALDIFHYCQDNKITLSPEWVPRNLNTQADVISKITDFDDWTTTPEFFVYINRLWGPHTIDRFANHKNTHLARFNSRYLVPGTETVDAFSVIWVGENNWLVPPVYCVTQVILHLLASRATGSLVVPYWPSSPFWPCLFASAQVCQPFVTDIRIFPSSIGILTLGDYKESLLGSTKFQSEVLAVRLEPSAT